MAHGILYLMAILDVVRHKALVSRVSKTMSTDLCAEPLEEAVGEFRRTERFNTDQGSQFTSEDSTRALKTAGIAISMDVRARWIDNVFIECLWRSVRNEDVYLRGHVYHQLWPPTLTAERALYYILLTHQIAGALSDAWYTYPGPGVPHLLPSEYAFARLANVIMTPHISSLTAGMIDRRWSETGANRDRFAQNPSFNNVIRPPLAEPLPWGSTEDTFQICADTCSLVGGCIMKLSGSIALVTGASRGIGKAIALAYAREGAEVVVTGRERAELAAVRHAVQALGRQCWVVEQELAQPDAVEELWHKVDREVERVDILVNNAGVGSSANPKAVIEFDDAFWDLTLRINLTVPYKLCKKVLPGMVARHFGRIIAIASISSFRPGIHDAAYAASKTGLLGLTRTIAREHVKDGITANALCPGTTVTRTADRRLQYDAVRLGKSFDEIDRGISPLGRRLEPEEVAPLAIYLASREAEGATGQTYVIDGGQLNS